MIFIERAKASGVLALFALVGSACGQPKEKPKTTPAATVQNAPKEELLATVTLTAESEARLGVELFTVEKRRVARARSESGEVMTPPGKSNMVTAPMAGTVMAAAEAPIPSPGSLVRRGAVIMRLTALPPGGDIAGASIRLSASRAKAARVEQLLKDGAASRRALEEAQAELALAEAGARAARPLTGRAEDAIPMTSPQDGVLRAVHVGAGQTVASGAALFEVDAQGALWVRVPLYVGDLFDVDPAAPAQVSMLSSAAASRFHPAAPVTGPPTSNPDAATTDLYYALQVGTAEFRPGQRVAVSLPSRSSAESLVVPWSAVLHDLSGGTWVYENVASHVYARRRVDVRYVADGLAILARGPAPGAQVVSVGAMEIFGTEFGTGK